MAIIKNKGRIIKNKGMLITTYDRDMSNFIDVLNADTNGVKLDAVQRRAVQVLVGGLKSIRDAGQSQTVWDRTDLFLPIMGGSDYKGKFNLRNPVDTDAAGRLIYIDGGTTTGFSGTAHLVNNNGLKGGAFIGNRVYDSSYLNNISIGSYVYAVPSSNLSVYVGSSVSPGSSYLYTMFHDSTNYSARVSGTFYNTPNSSAKGFFGCTLNGGSESQLTTAVQERILPQAFGASSFSAVSNSQFFIGASYQGTVGDPVSVSDAVQNNVYIAKYLTPNELLQLSRLSEVVNCILGRSTFRTS